MSYEDYRLVEYEITDNIKNPYLVKLLDESKISITNDYKFKNVCEKDKELGLFKLFLRKIYAIAF